MYTAHMCIHTSERVTADLVFIKDLYVYDDVYIYEYFYIFIVDQHISEPR